MNGQESFGESSLVIGITDPSFLADKRRTAPHGPNAPALVDVEHPPEGYRLAVRGQARPAHYLFWNDSVRCIPHAWIPCDGTLAGQPFEQSTGYAIPLDPAPALVEERDYCQRRLSPEAEIAVLRIQEREREQQIRDLHAACDMKTVYGDRQKARGDRAIRLLWKVQARFSSESYETFRSLQGDLEEFLEAEDEDQEHYPPYVFPAPAPDPAPDPRKRIEEFIRFFRLRYPHLLEGYKSLEIALLKLEASPGSLKEAAALSTLEGRA